MKKQNNKKEIQSRRKFFKDAAKKGLPLIAAAVLASTPIITNATESMVCENSCYGSCSSGCGSHNCKGYCKGTCQGTCEGSCGGCTGCKGTCQGSCMYGCRGGNEY